MKILHRITSSYIPSCKILKQTEFSGLAGQLVLKKDNYEQRKNKNGC